MNDVAATSGTAEREHEAGVRARPVVERVRGFLDRNVFVVFMLSICCIVQVRLIRHAVAQDGWYTLVSGRLIARTGIPHHDTLAYLTLGHRWVDQQWLGQLALYGLWAAGGWPLALAALVLLLCSAFGLAAAGARIRGASDRSTAIVLLPAFIIGLSNGTFRTQTASYFLFAVVFALLLREDRKKSAAVFLVFPVLVLWANIHGSVLVGAALVALLGIVEAGRGIRARARAVTWAPRSAALVVVPWLCALASPYGLELPSYYKSVLDNPTFSRAVTEWAPSSVRQDALFFALLLIGIWLAARSRSVLTLFSQLALFGTGIAGLDAARNEVWYALVAAAVLPAALDAAWPATETRRRAGLNIVLTSVGALVAVVSVASLASHDRAWYEGSYPPKALAAVETAAKADPSARIFSNEVLSDWLLFGDPALAGRIAYDARLELLSRKQMNRIVLFRAEEGVDWQRAANGYGLLVLGSSDDRGAVQLFKSLPGTKVLYRDSRVTVLQRPTS